MLNVELIVVKAEPDYHRFASQIRIDFVPHASDADPGVDAHLAALGFAGKGAKPLPTAHVAEPLGRQLLQPVLHARMRLCAVRHIVIAEQEIAEPGIGLVLGLRFVEVIQGFLHFFHGPKRAFHFPFGPGRGAAAIVPTGEMRPHLDVQIPHDLVKHLAARHRTIVQVQRVRAPTEGEARIGLGGHRAEQEFERGFHILPIGAVIFLIGHATAVIDHAIEHEGRGTLGGINPGGDFEMLEIGRADIKLPQLVAVLRLEAHGGGLPPQGLPIQAPLLRYRFTVAVLSTPLGACTRPSGVSNP